MRGSTGMLYVESMTGSAKNFAVKIGKGRAIVWLYHTFLTQNCMVLPMYTLYDCKPYFKIKKYEHARSAGSRRQDVAPGLCDRGESNGWSAGV
jgi:hypothetical protein